MQIMTLNQTYSLLSELLLNFLLAALCSMRLLSRAQVLHPDQAIGTPRARGEP